MRDSFGNIVYSLGGTLFAPGIGAAELMVGLIVALAFVWSALRAGLYFVQQHHDIYLPKRHH